MEYTKPEMEIIFIGEERNVFTLTSRDAGGSDGGSFGDFA